MDTLRIVAKYGSFTLLTLALASNAEAGFLDNINDVLNTVDRANDTADRVERSTTRTTDRLPTDTVDTVGNVNTSDYGGKIGMVLNKSKYLVNEEIRVEFNAPSTYDRSAWLGVLPSHVAHGSEALNDQYDSNYKHLSGRTSGVLVLKGPTQPGKYDVRLNDNDNNGNEVASVTITVYR